MAERERTSGREKERPAADRGQPFESMLRLRSGQPASLAESGFASAGFELLDEGGAWEQSGISRVPPQWEVEPEAQRSELEEAHAEIERLNAVLTQLRGERDQALWSALSLELELGEQVEAGRREAREARLLADRAVDRQRDVERKAKATLARFERRIADLRERLTACEELLGCLQQPGQPSNES